MTRSGRRPGYWARRRWQLARATGRKAIVRYCAKPQVPELQGALQQSASEVHCCPAPRQQSALQLSFMLQMPSPQ